MFYEINKNLCTVYTGLDPLKLLEYPAEDVFNLINGLIAYTERQPVKSTDKVTRVKAGDDWF